MSEITDRTPTAEMSTLPGAPTLLRTRRLIIAALVTAFLYNLVMTASQGGCPGGVTGDGGYIDANGQPTDTVPMCTNLTLGPSWWVFAAIALVVVLAITRVLKRASDQRAAARILDRAAILIFAIAGASVLISYVWFFAIPIESITEGGTVWYPFPFGSVETTMTPIDG
jgi:ABC-type Fe3+ transport system permease subunit